VRTHLFVRERSEADKLYYKTALDVQEKFHLPDGCSSMYDKKAYAFIHYIAPHLAQSFSKLDAAIFLIKMMPKNVQQPGRALREKLKESGEIMDMQVVLAECTAIVHDYKSSSTAGAHASINPSEFPGIASESLTSLCAVTGMEFAPKPNNSSYSGAYGYSGGGHHAAVAGSQQWCSGCGPDGTHLVHRWAKTCFLDPRKKT